MAALNHSQTDWLYTYICGNI